MTDFLPKHLSQYVTVQEYDQYTSIDHAVWRFILRISVEFFKTEAHPLYLRGIAETGMAIDRIPRISEMDAALKKFGWRAVAINGFIPPSIFLEFQARKILAIACDIRQIENLGYTPSPDIVHEAAGHAPIVADPEYRAYLEAYGEAASKAIMSREDLTLYQAIFELSEIKERPDASPHEIELAQKKFEVASQNLGDPSEAALLTRMAWWTTEYGLIAHPQGPKIYGAGLLSSVSESFHCMSPSVKKIPFSLQCVEQAYDITRPQPQLFVCESFKQLTQALHDYTQTMAFRRGGDGALQVAKKAGTVVTVQFKGGIWVSGVVSGYDAESVLFSEITQIHESLAGCDSVNEHRKIPRSSDVISVYGGPFDREREAPSHPQVKNHRSNRVPGKMDLERVYAFIRSCRQSESIPSREELLEQSLLLSQNYREDWLSRLELLELLALYAPQEERMISALKKEISAIKSRLLFQGRRDVVLMIDRGLELVPHATEKMSKEIY